MTTTDRGAAAVQSVDRAVSVLESLARHGEAGVTEIADELGVHKSTAFRLLGALENRGLVTQARERGKYSLGAGLLRLAGAAAGRLDIAQESAPLCRALADEIGDTVNVAVLDDDAAVNVAQARGAASVTSYNWIGRRTPLHATSSGKVLLAHAPAAVRERVFAAGPTAYTPQTVTAPALLARLLDETVERGYAVAVEELETGLNAVAAPVRCHDGTVAGALSVSGPAYRLRTELLPEIAERVVAVAALLSRRLGYPG
ncbi:IclR family transcriptional regulator [Streptomyces sp. NPDC094448]|uniref:IclR family transcriptional regulator n=1 Tax=Streptomyces sp. NPDC094448 TaxID=3366063 RepID=UPI003802EA77